MKKIYVSKLIIALSVAAFVACESVPEVREIPTQKTEEKAQPAEVNILAENAITVDVSIEGMTCAMGCANKIETEVASLVGVGYSRVDFDTETATFVFDKNELNADELVSFIGEINNGAYKAVVTKEQQGEINSKDEGKVEVDNAEAKLTKTSLQEDGINVVSKGIPSVNFPKLFTYFLKSLR